MHFVLLLFAAAGLSAQPAADLMLSRYAPADFELTADPETAIWRDAPAVVTEHGRYGEPLPDARTEIRSRWTDRRLYFLFISRFETLHLRSDPKPGEEIWGLWDYDVVEVFIGHDLERINRYKEFEVSPLNEWIDLDVDRERDGPKVDWKWNAGLESKTRINKDRRIWYCEMAIPWPAIDPRPPEPGRELRLNLYRIEGAEPNRKYVAWRPVHSPSFHTPQAFGRLRLVK